MYYYSLQIKIGLKKKTVATMLIVPLPSSEKRMIVGYASGLISSHPNSKLKDGPFICQGFSTYS
jgi:hypothetical protein